MMSAMILALLLATSAPAQTAVDPDVEAVKSAVAALGPHLNEFGDELDGKPGTDRLAETAWRAIQTWAAHWLDRHPGATSAALEKASAVLGKDVSGLTAVSLGHGDMLVSGGWGEMGNVFILGPSGTGYRAKWSIDAPQMRLNPAADRALSFWRAGVQNGHCAESCRMMDGANVRRLPDSAGGGARFSIDAGYAQEAGATVGRQLSFWSWQGGHARPLLLHDYSIMVDQGGGGLRGATLHVVAKGNWDTLFACGGCYGRETDLRFDVGPGPVRMLAPVSHTPEVDLVDRVFTRVLRHQPVGTLATPAALRVIRQQLDGPLHETDPQLKGFLGMLEGWQRWRTHGRRWACVDADEGGVTAFAFDAGLTRIVEARVMKPNGCKGEGPHQY